MRRIEKRGEVNVLCDDYGCSPATKAEAEFFDEITRLRAEVEALRADAKTKDALLGRSRDMLDFVGCSPEGASKDIRMAKELQRDIDAAREAYGEQGDNT